MDNNNLHPMHDLYEKLVAVCVDCADDACDSQPWNVANTFSNLPNEVKQIINTIIGQRPAKSTYEELCQYYMASESLLHQSKGVMHPGAVFLIGCSIDYINEHY